MEQRKTCLFSMVNGCLSKKKSTIASTGVSACVSTLDNAHARKPYCEANGDNRKQNTIPVIVIDTVSTYFMINTRFCARSVKEKTDISEITPIQIFDCAVKYKSRLAQCENPSFCALNSDKTTPPNEQTTISIFKVVEVLVLALILLSMIRKRFFYVRISVILSKRGIIGKAGYSRNASSFSFSP